MTLAIGWGIAPLPSITCNIQFISVCHALRYWAVIFAAMH
jgi:hypothetical protein